MLLLATHQYDGGDDEGSSSSCMARLITNALLATSVTARSKSILIAFPSTYFVSEPTNPVALVVVGGPDVSARRVRAHLSEVYDQLVLRGVT